MLKNFYSSAKNFPNTELSKTNNSHVIKTDNNKENEGDKGKNNSDMIIKKIINHHNQLPSCLL